MTEEAMGAEGAAGSRSGKYIGWAEDVATATPPAKADRKPPSLILHGKGDHLRVEVEGDFTRLLGASARNPQMSAGLIEQIAALGSHGRRFDETASNFALGFIDAMVPQDAAETMLLAQMAATHQATMMFARRLNHAQVIQQQDAAERAFNKLVRSYAAQMEALKRYRSKGQQVVRVERVTVESGAQAVVGNVNHGGGAKMGNDEYPMHQSPRCAAHSKRTGLPCRNPAVRGWAVCRMHGARGGTSPGPDHPAYRHGGRSGEAVEFRRMAAEITRAGRRLAGALEEE